MSLAMLLMYWYPMSTGGRRSVAMSMTPGGSHSALDPGVGFALVVLFCGSAVFTVASPVRGASHHGSHRRVEDPALVPVGGPSDGGFETLETGTSTAPHPLPVLADAAHVVMCVGMAFMLVLML